MNRLFGCAQGSPCSSGERSAIRLPFQSSQPSRSAGGFLVRPSNQTSCVFSFQAMLVKIALRAGGDRLDRGRVGVLVGVLGHAEDAELGVHAVQAAVLADPHPGDVVAVEVDVVAVAEGVGGERHGQVGLAAGAGEAARDVPLLAGLLVGDAEQHELLGQELRRKPSRRRRPGAARARSCRAARCRRRTSRSAGWCARRPRSRSSACPPACPGPGSPGRRSRAPRGRSCRGRPGC